MPDENHTQRAGSLPLDPGDVAARFAAELGVLCALCGMRASVTQRSAMIRSLGAYRFIDPEHQVLFEAIAALSRGPLFSASALTVQLNNRGFPDLDLEKYFANDVDFENGVEQARRLASGWRPSHRAG